MLHAARWAQYLKHKHPNRRKAASRSTVSLLFSRYPRTQSVLYLAALELLYYIETNRLSYSIKHK